MDRATENSAQFVNLKKLSVLNFYHVRILAITSFLLIVSWQGNAQTSIQLAPHSIKFWGITPSTITIQVQHSSFMVGYYHTYKTYYDELMSPTRKHSLGLFYKPALEIGKSFTLSPIVGVFNHRFPTDNGGWWAFGFNITYNATENVGFYYQHLSNAWLARINPGLDNIGIKLVIFRNKPKE